MSEELKKIIILDSKIADLIEDGIDNCDLNLEKQVLKVANLLKKLNNKEVLYVLANCESINEILDVTMFFNKYKINKKSLKENNSYKEEFDKLTSFLDDLLANTVCETEYLFICYKCDINNVANYLLQNMSNEDILKISNESNDWQYKLYLFQNLKE